MAQGGKPRPHPLLLLQIALCNGDPGPIADYGGDTLYATLIFVLLAFVRPRIGTASDRKSSGSPRP